jgi:hypothetical protein
VNVWERLKLAWRVLRGAAAAYRVTGAGAFDLDLGRDAHVIEFAFKPRRARVEVEGAATGGHFVAPWGDDAAPGTEAQPWATLAKAAATALPGDIVTFEDGAYDCGGGQAGWNSGGDGEGITFRARNRRRAILQLTSRGWLVELAGRAHLVFEGLVFTGDRDMQISRFVSLSDCDSVTFDDCEFKDAQGRVLALWGGCTNVKVLNCELHAEVTVRNHDVVHVRNAGNRDILIDGCEIYHAAHEGIRVNAGENIVIQNCVVRDNESHCVSIGHGDGTDAGIDGVVVRDNVIHGGGMWPTAEGQFHFGLRGKGGTTANVDCYRNDIRGNEVGGVVVLSDVGGPVSVCNNTLHGNNAAQNPDAADVLLRDLGSPGGAVRFKNNIIHNTGAQRTLSVESAAWESALDLDHNLYYADRAAGQKITRGGASYGTYAAYKAAGFEPGAVVGADPRFADPGKGDFELRAGSPAVDAGVDVGLPYAGFAPDIGAHERGLVTW